MIEHARSDLEYLRSGLHQIIPKKLLQPLSAEVCQFMFVNSGVAMEGTGVEASTAAFPETDFLIP